MLNLDFSGSTDFYVIKKKNGNSILHEILKQPHLLIFNKTYITIKKRGFEQVFLQRGNSFNHFIIFILEIVLYKTCDLNDANAQLNKLRK